MLNRFSSWPEIATATNDPSTPTVGNFLKWTGLQICDLYCNYPEWFLAGAGLSIISTSGASTGAAGLLLGSLASVCACTVPPPPPGGYDQIFPFTGGQCACVQYQITLTIERYNAQPSPPPPTSVEVINVGVYKGAIQNLRIGGIAGTEGGFQFIYADTRGDVNTPCLPAPVQTQLSQNQNGFKKIIQAVVTRIDGLPDNCGNPPPYIPPPPPPAEFDRKFPYLPPSINFPTGVFVPVVFAPIYVNTSIPLNIDVGGVQFILDVGGLWIQGSTFNFNFGVDGTDTPTDLLPDPLLPKPPDPIPLPPLPTDLTPICEEPLPEPTPEEKQKFQTQNLAIAESGSAQINGLIQFVELFLEEDPPARKIIYSPEPYSDYYYTGWAQFGYGITQYQKDTIGFENNIYYPPAPANRFSYTCTYGSKARAVIYYLPPEVV